MKKGIIKERLKKTVFGTKYWALPGLFSDMMISDDFGSEFLWPCLKNLVIWPGIVFGAIMGSIYGVNKAKVNDIQNSYKKNIAEVTETLADKMHVDGFEGKEIVPGTFLIDPTTNKICGLMSYTALDKESDKAKFIGRYTADVNNVTLKDYYSSLNDYEKFCENYENYISTKSKTKGKLSYWSVAGTQSKFVNSYKSVTKNMINSLKDVVDSSSNYTIEPIAKAYDFNQSLLKNALYTNPTVLSDTNGWVSGLFTSGHIHTEYITNGTALLNVSPVKVGENDGSLRFYINYLETSGKDVKYREAKVVVDTKDYNQTKYSNLSEYAYNQFVDGNIKKFSQNEVQPKETIEDDVLGL